MLRQNLRVVLLAVALSIVGGLARTGVASDSAGSADAAVNLGASSKFATHRGGSVSELDAAGNTAASDAMRDEAAIAMAALAGCDPCSIPGSIAENEACGASVNNTCTEFAFSYTLLDPCGPAICGRLWANAGAADVDWYVFYAEEIGGLSVVTSAPTVFALYELADVDLCPEYAFGGAMVWSEQLNDCSGLSFALPPLPAGAYALRVSLGTGVNNPILSGYPCNGPEPAKYWFELAACAESDCDSDGIPSYAEADPYCCACICESDPFCCTTAWDSACALAAQLACNKDCNQNGTLDTLDVLLGISPDCNMNCVPDECEAVPPTSASASPQSYCAGTPGNITLTAVGGSGTTLQWFGTSCGTGLVGTGNNLVIPKPTTTKTYYARWTTACGQSSCVQTTVTVNPLPAVPVITSSPQTVCLGQPVTLTGTVTGANVVLKWRPGSCAAASTFTGSPYTFTPTATGTTTWYASAMNTVTGCESACVTTTVTVNPLPAVPVITSSPQTVCLGQPVTLTGTVTGANVVLKWRPGSCAAAASFTGSPYTFTPTATGTTTWYASAMNTVTGCESACVTTTVTVNPLPAVPVITSSPQTVCLGQPVTLTGTVTGANVVLKWRPGSCAAASTFTGSPYTFTPTATGTTTWYASAMNTVTGCESACVTTTVTVNPLPAVPVITSSPQTVCLGQPVTLTGTVTGANVVLKWRPGSCAAASTFTGSPYTFTPTATGTTTWYASAMNTVTGCESACVTTTVTVNPLPAVPVITSSPQTVCLGQPVTLTGTVTGANVVLKWRPGSCAAAASFTGSPYTFTPTATGTTTWYASALNTVTGCESACVTTTVTVNPLPAVPVITSSPQTVCLGQPVTLTGTVTGANVVLKWRPGSCAAAASFTGSPYTFTPTATGTTTWYASAMNTVTGCESACVTTTVTVNPLPAVPVITSSPQTVCLGQPVTLTGTVTGANVVLKWRPGSCAAAASFTGSPYTFTPTATGTTTWYASAMNTVTGCESACVTTTVTVNPLPVAPTSASSNPQSYCAGTAGTITLTAVGGSGTTLEWFDGSCGVGPVGTGNNLVLAKPTGTKTYYVRWTTATCGSSTCAQTTVTVNPLPAVPTGGAASPATICAGASSTLSVAAVAGTTFDWFTGSCGGTAAGTGTSITVSPTTTTTYYVRATNSCGTSACATVTVTVNPLAVAPTSASASPQSYCAGTPGNLTLTAAGGSGTTLEWFDGSCGGTAVGTGNNLVIPKPTATKAYFVRWTNSCGSSTCASVTVTVTPLPTAPISASASDPIICQGQSTTLTASGGSGTTLEWFVGSCPTGAATAHMTGSSITVAPTQTTTYHVRWTNSCGESGCEEVTVTVIPTCAPSAQQKVWFVIYGTSTGSPWDWEITGTTFKIGGTVTPSSGDTAKMMADLLALSVAEVGKCGPLAEGCGTLAPAQVCVYVNPSCPDRAVINIRACEVVTLCVKNTATPSACCPITGIMSLSEACSPGGCQVNPSFFMLETEGLDCNQNDIDDGIDVLLGTSEDANGDSIPDECDACLGDLNLDGTVDGADLGLVLGAWGTDGAANGADLNGDDVVDGADLGLLLGAWGECRSGAPAALFAYEGFDYHPAGDALSAYPDGGVGWLGHWIGESPDPWDVFAPGLSYSDAEGNALVVGGSRIQGRSARSLHTLDLDGGPLGDAQGTLWISMLVEASATESDGSWMGLSLPAAGPHPFLFLGKPREMPTWAIDNGVAGDAWASRVPSRELAFLVLRIDFREGPDDVALWVNPSLEGEPALESADVWAPHYGDFVGITQVRVDVGATHGEFSGSIDEIRLGSTYRDVAPIDRGSRSDAVQRRVEEPRPQAPVIDTSAASDKKR